MVSFFAIVESLIDFYVSDAIDFFLYTVFEMLVGTFIRYLLMIVVCIGRYLKNQRSYCDLLFLWLC